MLTLAGDTCTHCFKAWIFPPDASTCDGSEERLRHHSTVFDAAGTRGSSSPTWISHDGSSCNSSPALARQHSAQVDTRDGSEGLLTRKYSSESNTTEALSTAGSGSFGRTNEFSCGDELEWLLTGTSDSPGSPYRFSPLTDRSSNGARPSSSAPQETSNVRPALPQTSTEAGCLAGCLPWFLSGPRLFRPQCDPSKVVLCCGSSGSSVEYNLDHLECIGQLGKGSFGSVLLVRCKATGQNLALKAVCKGVVAERSLQRYLSTEKRVMQQCQSPFVVRLVATFSSTLHAYFLEEALMGGDLRTVYSHRLLFGSGRHARFYTACILRALEHLHERGIIYRDLKLENVVLGANGYGKLCDFGLARILSPAEGSRAYSVCGTPDYMAPEVTLGTDGYSTPADWWSLGILVCELMYLGPPSAERGMEVAKLPEEAAWADVARSLLRPEPGDRLPEREGGVRRFEEQAWFCGFDWSAFSRCSLQAPYIPAPASPEDLPE